MSKLLDGMLETRTVESLAKLKIFSLDDFLRADIEKLAAAGLKPEDSMKLKLDFSKLVLPVVVTGDDYYRMQLKKCSIMHTWIPGLDELLEGGLRMGTLLEFCGASGSGKTQLCLNIAVKLAAEYKIEVLYVDTKGDLVASHLASLIEELGLQKRFMELYIARHITADDFVTVVNVFVENECRVSIPLRIADVYGRFSLKAMPEEEVRLQFRFEKCHPYYLLMERLGIPYILSEPKDSDTILERIKVAKTRTLHSLISTLHHLQDAHKAQKRIKMIIIDSLASLYFPFIGARTSGGNEGLSLLNHVASLLKKLAAMHCLSVLIVNLASQWNQEEELEGGDCGDEESKQTSNKDPEEALKPAMGKYWAHVPNTRLFVARDEPHSKIRTLRVHKSEYLASGKTAKFEINPSGTIK